VCATNADLPQLAERGDFRADLLDRLAFDVIMLPPLRERKEDILSLAEHYAIKMCRELQLEYFVGFTEEAQQSLLDYAWPGNVRELKNVIERAIYRHGLNADPIEYLVFNPFETGWENALGHSSEQGEQETEQPHVGPTINFPLDYKQWQEEQDITLLNRALEEAKFNQRQAADLLGLSYHQLRGMVRKYGLVGQS
jgi:psp operon transcriptional activator